eukprot:scaffold11421_cov67-Phaeocystis_antarctica.AAC.3
MPRRSRRGVPKVQDSRQSMGPKGCLNLARQRGAATSEVGVAPIGQLSRPSPLPKLQVQVWFPLTTEGNPGLATSGQARVRRRPWDAVMGGATCQRWGERPVLHARPPLVAHRVLHRLARDASFPFARVDVVAFARPSIREKCFGLGGADAQLNERGHVHVGHRDVHV